MILFKQIEVLQGMHRLITKSCTGTPDQFAKQLGVSERHLRRIIDEVKDMGAPISYSRRDATYFYHAPFEIDVSCTFRCLSDEEQQNISAGTSFLTNLSFTAFFCP